MRLLQLPAVMPAVGALAGATYAINTGSRPLLGFTVLLALGLGLAFSRRQGWWVAWLAVGALSGALTSPPPGAPQVDPERPVEARVRLVTPWKEGAYGWSAKAVVEALRQGEITSRQPREAWLELGGRDESPPSAGILEVKGYLQRRQAFHNEPRIPPGPWRIRVKSRRLVEIAGEPGGLLRVSRALRGRVEKALAAASLEASPPEPPPALALVRALLLGDPSRLPPEWVRGLRRSGLGHLLAISGLHTSGVLLLAALACRLLPRAARLPSILLVLAAFVLLVGPRPSVLRAAAMAVLGYGALVLGRAPTALNALGCFVLGTVLLDPLTVVELGFRLSVAATAGILLLAPYLAPHLQATFKIPSFLALALGGTAAAQAATVPLAVPAFSVLHPASALFNLLALPWIGVFLGVAILWTLLACLSPEAAAALVPVLEALARPVEGLAHLPAHPWISLPWVAGFGTASLGAAAILAAFRWPGKVGAPMVLLATLCHQVAPVPADPELTLFDVGQGEAILLRSAGRTLLIDGGGSAGGGIGDRVLLPALARLGVRRLDAVAVTHPDIDHCRGLLELADYLPVGELRTPSRWRSSECVRELEEGRRIPWRRLDAGQVAVVGRWRLEALHPSAERVGGLTRRDKTNDGSLVLSAEARGVKILLTGDLESAGERRLRARYGKALESDVLKIGHHGSRSSTDPLFLRAVAPRLALVSAGRNNRFGHPHPKVLDRLHRRNVRVLRTDREGAIHLSIGPGGKIRWRRPGVLNLTKCVLRVLRCFGSTPDP